MPSGVTVQQTNGNYKMTVDELRELANVNRQTVYRWIDRGWVKATKHPLIRAWNIDRESADKLLEDGPPDPPYKNK